MAQTKAVIRLDVREGVSPEGLSRLAARFPERVARILTQGATRARLVGAKEIRSRYNFSPAYLREHLTTRSATRNALTASVVARRRVTLLGRFAPKPVFEGGKPAGISVWVSKISGRKTLPSAFLVPLRAGKAEGLNGMGIAVRNTVLRRMGIAPYDVGGEGQRAYSVLHSISVFGAAKVVENAMVAAGRARIEEQTAKEVARAFREDL